MRGSPLHVMHPDAVVTRRRGRIAVVRDGTVVASAPLVLLSEVVVWGQAGITTPALHLLLSQDVPVVLLRSDGRARGRLEPPGCPQVRLRQQQLARSLDPMARVDLSRSLVQGKLHNQRVLLARRSRTAEQRDQTVDGVIARLANLERRAAQADCVEELFGVEGAGSRAYFHALRCLLPPPAGFHRRDPRGPDVVNPLVNYCSALLREVVIGGVVAVGLDPHVSFLHTPFRGRPTLAFDLMEEWRPVLVESTVLSLLNLKAVGPEDVQATQEGPRLGDGARAATIRRFYDRLEATASTWPSSGLTYREHVLRQSRTGGDDGGAMGGQRRVGRHLRHRSGA